MTLLIISPDYASHLYPLAALGNNWRENGEQVFVATGPATANIVESFGFTHIPLKLGRGSNPGVIRAEEQPRGEDETLRGFFEATRGGMIETLTFQANVRMNDFMWEPVNTARAVQDVVEMVDPEHIIVDHLAFSARLGLAAARRKYIDVVLGHPSALPLPALGEVYGFPPTWPQAFAPSAQELSGLHAICTDVATSFTAQWNAALAELAPEVAPSEDAFAEYGDLLVFNYPEELVDSQRISQLPPHIFMGSSIRSEPTSFEVDQWISASEEPFVYVSFGSFLSVRDDVLSKVVAALRQTGLRAAVALGAADRQSLGSIPEDWLVGEFLPQITLLQSAAVSVTHGGNNSLTESLTYGVPSVVLPFSTDQFAGAAAIEQAGFGTVLAPNHTTISELKEALQSMLDLRRGAREELHILSNRIREGTKAESLHQLTELTPTSFEGNAALLGD
ncbi:nucleotide disphospho-sugar-binding domain-containing protein [Glutamicibacter ardleyensis]|uniref:nucleotide disphospho-sugar-binding domain-containing protein n=1 Tax=Glutamicibacter ardleyensis TaxID=225894 RepID=UPI003FD5C23C